jgi:hypothetical protein
MEVMFEGVAGLDIGKATLTACVRTPGPRGRRAQTRTFSTMTRSLQVMRECLPGDGAAIAAMESTSTSWKPPFYCLAAQDPGQERGADRALRCWPRSWRAASCPALTWSRTRSPSSRGIATACRPWAHQLALLQTIPGVGEKVAQVILAETGGDMSRFTSAAHLAS